MNVIIAIYLAGGILVGSTGTMTDVFGDAMGMAECGLHAAAIQVEMRKTLPPTSGVRVVCEYEKADR